MSRLPNLRPGYRALIVGAGGIGQAFADELTDDPNCAELIVASRSGRVRVDVTDEQSVATLFAGISTPLDLVIVASGLLHGEGLSPEKSLKEVDADALAALYRVNTIGPALIARHAERLLPKDRTAVFAVLGARVGSIADNRLGGWYGYRMAKAAAAQFVRTLAIEWARTRPHSIALLLHPGTVDTALSAPFQRNVPADRLFAPDRSASALLDIVGAATAEVSGRHLAWDGSEIPG